MSRIDFNRYGPFAMLAFFIATPLVIWAATSGGDSRPGGRGLIVEFATGERGEPELLVSIDAPGLRVTRKNSTVLLRCLDGSGNTVVSGTHPWPFGPEAGFNLPHTHQPAPPDKLDQVRRCSLLGTNRKLETDVR